ncbi:MAG: hypothetical protein U0236_01750 [Nitrospira sp.]
MASRDASDFIVNNDKPLLFISHKHADSKIADTLTSFVRGRTGGRLSVYQSSSFFAEGPDVGRSLSRQIRTAVAAASVVILVYTSPDQDWNYCMWECGIASDPESPEAKIIVLQCGATAPTLFTDQVHVKARNLLDVQKLTNELLTDPDFCPGRTGALTELSSQGQEVQQAATELHEKLQPLLPDHNEGVWRAQPFLRLQIDLQTEANLLSAMHERQCDQVGDLLMTRCMIVSEERAGDRIFGLSEPCGKSLVGLRDIWKMRNKEASDQWIKSLTNQILDAIAGRLPSLQWSEILDRQGAVWYAPVLSTWRRTSSPPSVLFDVYFMPSPERATQDNVTLDTGSASTTEKENNGSATYLAGLRRFIHPT